VHPAEEKARMEMVKRALRILAEGRPVTRMQCFPGADEKTKKVQQRVLDKLTEHRVIEKKVGPVVGDPTIYSLLHSDAIKALLSSDKDISDVIWPPPAPQVPTIVKEEAVAGEPPKFIPPEAPPTVEEYMAGVLERFAAIAETLNHMHQRLESLDKKITKIYKDLEA
jgi:hypothetical protein